MKNFTIELQNGRKFFFLPKAEWFRNPPFQLVIFTAADIALSASADHGLSSYGKGTAVSPTDLTHREQREW